MKKILLLLCSLLITLSLVGCSNSADSLEKTDMSDYNLIKDVDKLADFYKMDFDALKNKIDNKDTFIFLVAYPSCVWCQKAITSFNQFALNNNIPLYYLNVSETSEESFNYISNLLADVLTKVYGSTDMYTPMLVGVKDGTPVSIYYGGIENSGDQYTEAEITELINRYQAVYNATFK